MTVANRYVTGNPVRLWVSFRNEAGLPQDPTNVKLTVKDPDGVEHEFEDEELTNTDVGEWEFLFLADEEGDYPYRWEGFGTLRAAAESMFVAETRL